MNSLNSLELENKNIVLRVDLNVPIQDGKILDRTRIDAVRPTIDFLLSQDSRILLISHLGRPTEGNLESKYSLRPIKEEFEKNNDFKISDFEEIKNVFDNNIKNRRQLTLNQKMADNYFMDCIEFGVPLSHASINENSRKNVDRFSSIMNIF